MSLDRFLLQIVTIYNGLLRHLLLNPILGFAAPKALQILKLGLAAGQ